MTDVPITLTHLIAISGILFSLGAAVVVGASHSQRTRADRHWKRIEEIGKGHAEMAVNVATLIGSVQTAEVRIGSRIDLLTAAVQVSNGRLAKAESEIDNVEAQMLNLLARHHDVTEGLLRELREAQKARGL